MGWLSGIPILSDVEKAWNDNVAQPLDKAVVQPVTKTVPKIIDVATSDFKKNVTDPAGSFIGDTWQTVKEKNPIVALTPAITAVDVIDKTVVQGKDIDTALNETSNEQLVLSLPKKVINEGSKVLDASGKAIENGWNNVTNTVTNTYENTVEKTKEVFNNVTKGVSDALPIIAIGGAAVLVVSLLLGRR